MTIVRLFAPLGGVVEHDAVAGEADVLFLEGGGAVVMVEVGVPFLADAEQAEGRSAGPRWPQPGRGSGRGASGPAAVAVRSPGSALANLSMCLNFWASRCSRQSWW